MRGDRAAVARFFQFLQDRAADFFDGPGPTLGPSRWVVSARIEDDRSSFPESERIVPDELSEFVRTFDPRRRRVPMICGQGRDIPAHWAEALPPVGRVLEVDRDHINFWTRLAGIIDPILGVSRLDACVTDGYTQQSIGFSRGLAETDGRAALWHVAQLSEGEPPGIPNMPSLDEVGFGLSEDELERVRTEHRDLSRGGLRMAVAATRAIEGYRPPEDVRSHLQYRCLSHFARAAATNGLELDMDEETLARILNAAFQPLAQEIRGITGRTSTEVSAAPATAPAAAPVATQPGATVPAAQAAPAQAPAAPAQAQGVQAAQTPAPGTPAAQPAPAAQAAPLAPAPADGSAAPAPAQADPAQGQQGAEASGATPAQPQDEAERHAALRGRAQLAARRAQLSGVLDGRAASEQANRALAGGEQSVALFESLVGDSLAQRSGTLTREVRVVGHDQPIQISPRAQVFRICGEQPPVNEASLGILSLAAAEAQRDFPEVGPDDPQFVGALHRHCERMLRNSGLMGGA